MISKITTTFNKNIHLKWIGIYLFINCFVMPLNAQEIIGGSLRYTYDNNIATYYITIYSLNEPSIYANLEYGDGGLGIVYLTSSMINDSVYINTGSAMHVLISSGLFKISCESDLMASPLRNFYNTEPAKFEMHVIISNNFDEPINSAPEPLNNLLDFETDAACYVTQNLNFYDADGDSLAYAMTPFYAQIFDETYYVTPEATDSIGIDEAGNFYWRNAIYYGRYALQFEVSEYRDGVLMGTSMYKSLYYLNCGVLDVKNNPTQAFTVYPNPATENIYISDTNLGVTAYSIYDATGKQIVDCSNMSGTASVDVSGLLPGIYSLQVAQNGVFHSTRFIKL
jgi:hypothetical protein